MKIQMNLSKHLKAKPTDESKLGFGNYFSDHMLMINYTEGKGWHDARIEPYGNLSLDPACQVLHYGQEIFEGMKCYRTPENGFNLFRPTANFERMARSSERMEDGMESLLALLNVEKEWTPHQEGTSLYIRPTMIALDAHLGVSASKTYLYYVILSPSGAYYAAGLAPVGI
ncbi:MAG: branched chain amino acid aminotransferase, partial [Clostridia bacterium]